MKKKIKQPQQRVFRFNEPLFFFLLVSFLLNSFENFTKTTQTKESRKYPQQQQIKIIKSIGDVHDASECESHLRCCRRLRHRCLFIKKIFSTKICWTVFSLLLSEKSQWKSCRCCGCWCRCSYFIFILGVFLFCVPWKKKSTHWTSENIGRVSSISIFFVSFLSSIWCFVRVAPLHKYTLSKYK